MTDEARAGRSGKEAEAWRARLLQGLLMIALAMFTVVVPLLIVQARLYESVLGLGLASVMYGTVLFATPARHAPYRARACALLFAFAVISLPGLVRVQKRALALEEIVAAGSRAARLTQQLLTVGRKAVSVPAVLNPSPLLAEIGRLVERVLPENIRLHTAVAADTPAIFADAAQLHHVILNLWMVQALRDAGHEVLAVGDGTAALELAGRYRGRIDLLCSDGVMPGIGTGELIKGFRHLFPDAPIIVCSGHIRELSLRKQLEARDVHYLAKPFTGRALADALVGHERVQRS